MNPCKQAKNYSYKKYFLNSEHGLNTSEKAFRIAFKSGRGKNNRKKLFDEMNYCE